MISPLGDSTVGKSALTQVYCSDGAQYPKTYLMASVFFFTT